MIQKDKTYNLATFFCLYIAQTIPMSFFSTVIPVMMRQENFSLSAIGLLQLIKLPWILKFLWSPMVDRHAVTTGDYKRWIFSSELIYAGLIRYDKDGNVSNEVASSIETCSTEIVQAASFSICSRSISE